MNSNTIERVKKIQLELLNNKHSVFMIINDEDSNWESLYYMSGFRGTSGALLIYSDHVELILDSRYTEQGKMQSPHDVLEQKSGLVDAIIERLVNHNIKEIYCEAKRTSASIWLKLLSSKREVRDASEQIEALRRKKDEYEISCIIKAGQIASTAFLETLNHVKEGMSEKELQSLLNYKIATLGGEIGFDMIVASGIRSALPHGRASEKTIQKNEWVTVDFGARWNGYFCDITRNFSIGVPDDRAVHCHSILLEAHRASAALLQNNVGGSEIHNRAVEILAAHNLDAYFTHGLGHGLGLEIHESPYLRKSINDILRTGDVVTIEPGVYIEGWGGLRIEDDYVITEKGAQRLTDKLNQQFYLL